jgi:plasmid stability protein
MAQVVVQEIEDKTFAALKNRAKRHRRSLEAEIRLILTDAARHEDADNVWAAIDRFRAKLKRTKRRFSDSAVLVREDRDR